METVLTFVFGLLLRIGIPVAVTALVFFLLRRLDERWQKEAQAIPVISSQRPCWEIKELLRGETQELSGFYPDEYPMLAGIPYEEWPVTGGMPGM